MCHLMNVKTSIRERTVYCFLPSTFSPVGRYTARVCMEIKQYIDYFDEISHLKRDVQFELLEQASKEIHKTYRFPILTFISLFVRLTFVLVFTGGSYLLFGFSNWVLTLSLILGLLCSKITVTEINDSIVLKFLKNILSGDAV